MNWTIIRGANSHIFDDQILDENAECIAFCNEDTAYKLVALPDLLEALEEVAKNENLEMPATTWKKVLSAIAKAKQITK